MSGTMSPGLLDQTLSSSLCSSCCPKINIQGEMCLQERWGNQVTANMDTDSPHQQGSLVKQVGFHLLWGLLGVLASFRGPQVWWSGSLPLFLLPPEEYLKSRHPCSGEKLHTFPEKCAEDFCFVKVWCSFCSLSGEVSVSQKSSLSYQISLQQ